MQIKRSPGGSLFPYYYKDGELFCLHFGSYFSDEEAVIAMMKAEEDFINTNHRPMGIWIDLYETKLSDRVIQQLVETLTQIAAQITKLGLVGCSPIARWKINRWIRQTRSLSCLSVKYFDDPEVAKTWLVNELE
jgi:hypothetical protein